MAHMIFNTFHRVELRKVSNKKNENKVVNQKKKKKQKKKTECDLSKLIPNFTFMSLRNQAIRAKYEYCKQ